MTRQAASQLDPNHPLAVNGYIEMPNVNEMHEMINAVAAARAYDANITMMNATRTMANAALQLIA